jgi:PqqD family protein of HPr-rel-A system
MAALWRVLPGQSLHHRDWGDECVLYNNLSGDTHLIEASALQVLQALQRGACSEAALTATLRAELQLDDEEASHIPALLADLCALQLIETTPC